MTWPSRRDEDNTAPNPDTGPESVGDGTDGQAASQSPWAPPTVPQPPSAPAAGASWAATPADAVDATQPLSAGQPLAPQPPQGLGASAQFPTTELPAGHGQYPPSIPPTVPQPSGGYPLAGGEWAAPDPAALGAPDAGVQDQGMAAVSEPGQGTYPWPSGSATSVGPSLPEAAPGRPRSALAQRLLKVAALVLVAMVAGYVGHRLHVPEQSTVDVSHSATPTNPEGQSRPPESVAGIAAQVLPSVIAIETRSSFGHGGTGSGFVIRNDGHILTNNHVVADVSSPDEIQVVFEDGSRGPARLVGRSVSYDLAVLKVDRDDLIALPMGNSDEAVVGDSVIAVGSPLGFQSTVTTGIVSAKNRPVSAMRDGTDQAFINGIQTDAAINPGNSGGPLLNAAGQVIGVNSAIAHLPSAQESSGGSIGLGFAIPSNQAARTAAQLIESGKATYPIVGVMLDTEYRGEGVKIVSQSRDGQDPVTRGSSADRAGIKPGDVVTHYNGRPINDANELIVAIRAQQQGDEVTLTVVSGGAERTITMVLDQTKVDD